MNVSGTTGSVKENHSIMSIIWCNDLYKIIENHLKPAGDDGIINDIRNTVLT